MAASAPAPAVARVNWRPRVRRRAARKLQAHASCKVRRRPRRRTERESRQTGRTYCRWIRCSSPISRLRPEPRVHFGAGAQGTVERDETAGVHGVHPGSRAARRHACRRHLLSSETVVSAPSKVIVPIRLRASVKLRRASPDRCPGTHAGRSIARKCLIIQGLCGPRKTAQPEAQTRSPNTTPPVSSSCNHKPAAWNIPPASRERIELANESLMELIRDGGFTMTILDRARLAVSEGSCSMLRSVACLLAGTSCCADIGDTDRPDRRIPLHPIPTQFPR